MAKLKNRVYIDLKSALKITKIIIHHSNNINFVLMVFQLVHAKLQFKLQGLKVDIGTHCFQN